MTPLLCAPETRCSIVHRMGVCFMQNRFEISPKYLLPMKTKARQKSGGVGGGGGGGVIETRSGSASRGLSGSQPTCPRPQTKHNHNPASSRDQPLLSGCASYSLRAMGGRCHAAAVMGGGVVPCVRLHVCVNQPGTVAAYCLLLSQQDSDCTTCSRTTFS